MEESVLADSRTVRLKEIVPGRYRFQTGGFPYDGELVVVNTTVDDRAASYEGGYTMGIVEVELPDASEEFLDRYARSLVVWEGGHALSRGEDGAWLTDREFQERMGDEYAAPGWFGPLSGWLWPLVLLGLVIALLYTSFRAHCHIRDQEAIQQRYMEAQARSMELVEESVKLSRDSHRVFHEILEILREGEEGGDRG